MKVYTKTGDKGETSLYGGVKTSKSNIRIDAYGTVDELNAAIGVIRSYEVAKSIKEQLINIQKNLFHLGGELATPKEKMYLANGKLRLPKIMNEEDVIKLENWIDEMEQELTPLTHFILPGGYLPSAQTHLARCICRRAERITVTLQQHEELNEFIVMYLNRLSDYLFVLTRLLDFNAQVKEIKWLPNE